MPAQEIHRAFGREVEKANLLRYVGSPFLIYSAIARPAGPLAIQSSRLCCFAMSAIADFDLFSVSPASLVDGLDRVAEGLCKYTGPLKGKAESCTLVSIFRKQARARRGVVFSRMR